MQLKNWLIPEADREDASIILWPVHRRGGARGSPCCGWRDPLIVDIHSPDLMSVWGAAEKFF